MTCDVISLRDEEQSLIFSLFSFSLLRMGVVTSSLLIGLNRTWKTSTIYFIIIITINFLLFTLNINDSTDRGMVERSIFKYVYF